MIRGNVDTRIKKLEDGEYDAILLSKAGVDALQLNHKISQEFKVEELIPCAGQGIIAVQCRKNDEVMQNLLEKINDDETRNIANVERQVLKILEGDCDTAIGVYASIEDQNINLTTELFSVDGSERYFMKESKVKNLTLELGKYVGENLKLKSKGSYKR